jgi:hypothetical protein
VRAASAPGGWPWFGGQRTQQSRASAAPPSAVVHRLSVGRVDVGRGEVWAPAYEPESVAPLPGLQGSVGGDLDDDGRGHLGQRNGRCGLGPAADADLVRPRMIAPGGLKDCAELAGLLGGQRDRAPDLYEVFTAVAPGDHGLGSADRAEHAADDDLDGVAVPDLSSGSQGASRTVVLRVLIGTCATPMAGSGAAWVDGKQAPERDLGALPDRGCSGCRRRLAGRLAGIQSRDAKEVVGPE